MQQSLQKILFIKTIGKYGALPNCSLHRLLHKLKIPKPVRRFRDFRLLFNSSELMIDTFFQIRVIFRHQVRFRKRVGYDQGKQSDKA